MPDGVRRHRTPPLQYSSPWTDDLVVTDTSDTTPPSEKQMRLRYPCRCRSCSTEMAAGTTAIYDRSSRSVTCLTCTPPVQDEVDDSDGVDSDDVAIGVAGASAQREFARRSATRQARIRREHPHIGGLLLALSDDPQSTRAWATGAVGEELLGARLDRATASGVRILHDRRVPRSRANIDHLVVGPAGVFVIDAKRYKGRPSRRVEGGLFRPRVEKLMVGSRNCSALLAGVHKQVDLVGAALDDAGLDDVPVNGVLCFVQADWPLIGGAFEIERLHVLWPRRAVSLVQSPGPLDAESIDRIHRRLATAFPSA